uniref:Uncharacterized protein n=1 Tax=Arion vulgaris TaxID=1028688 RepID=A0A0B6YPP5_9EUPU
MLHMCSGSVFFQMVDTGVAMEDEVGVRRGETEVRVLITQGCLLGEGATGDFRMIRGE